MGGKRWVTESRRDLKREQKVLRKANPDYKSLTKDLPTLPTRSECRTGPRPCPHVRCRYHLMIDVITTGALRIYGTDPDDLLETCSLDVAEAGAVTLERVADLLGVTRERIRQIEEEAICNLSDALAAQGMDADEVQHTLAQSAITHAINEDRHGSGKGEVLHLEEMLTVARACVKRLDKEAGIARRKRFNDGQGQR